MPSVASPSTFTSSSPPEDSPAVRREERLAIALPVKLIYPRQTIDEMIPAVLIDLSAVGVKLLTDQRFSLRLPPPRNTRLEVEFFLDEIEIRQVPIQVLRVAQRQNYQLVLGCKFLNLPTPARLSLRAEVAKRRSMVRP
jgi:PilZ domain